MKKSAKPEKSAEANMENATPTIPPKIFAQASPRSLGGVSLFDAGSQGVSSINSQNVVNFFSEENTIRNAVTQLESAGFEILQVTPTTINIAGSQQTYEKAFNTQIVANELPTIKAFGEETTATFLDSPDTSLPGLISTANSAFANVLEGVAIEEPRYFMAPSMFAPLKSYWHLRVPGDISLGCNADKAHRGGITGKGIKVAMCDTGWYQHPYFVGRGYKAAPVVLGPAAANPLKDEVGHGTGESANIFAVAPDVDFMPVKMSFVNSIGAFNAAVGLSPHIITCSWGSSKQFGPLSAADLALAAAIATAVASGIIVVFSAGNGHYGFPGQHPDVISAGGVFMNVDESLRASDYASGFMSTIYPGRRVPDLCGLVGMRPRAAYIMLPIEPSDEIDTDLAGGTHPNADETTNNDGWAAFSGTSAAAPQLAGAAALVKQACSALTPAQVRDILKRSARDVTAGNASPSTGSPAAGVGPDNATGNGLVDAHKAVLFAKIQCIGPIVPIVPVLPVTPVAPIGPVNPITPITPVAPIGPINPITPVVPVGPIQPVAPVQPISPVAPIGPPIQSMQGSAAPTAGSPSATPSLSEQDVKGLEDLANQSELNLDDFKS